MRKKVNSYVTSGTVNGTWVSDILRDTGCSCVLVSEDLLPDVDTTNCEMTKVSDYLGRSNYFPKVRCYLRCPYYVGWVNVLRAPIKFGSVLIGNVPGLGIQIILILQYLVWFKEYRRELLKIRGFTLLCFQNVCH